MIKWLKRLWLSLAIVLIVFAIMFAVVRALAPWAKLYKTDIEQHLSTLMGQPVSIQSIETGWYWFEPVIKLNQVVTYDADKQVLNLDRMWVGIRLFSSLWHWQLQPGIVYIDDAKFTLRQNVSGWQLDGLHHLQQPVAISQDTYLPALHWLLSQQKIILKNVSLLVHLQDGSLLPISGLNLTVLNRNEKYQVKGHAHLEQTTPTELSFLASLSVKADNGISVSGKAYFSVREFLLAQWQFLIPQHNVLVEGGRGDLSLWLDVGRNKLTKVQSQLNFTHVAWSRLPGIAAMADKYRTLFTGLHVTQYIQSIQGNLAWVRSADGWRLSGDGLQLVANGWHWPETTLQVDYQKDAQKTSIFLHDLNLEALAALDLGWPRALRNMLDLHPRGELSNLQLSVQAGDLDFFMTRFQALGWDGKKDMPAVRNLAGALYWQPTEGHLELDGENTKITLGHQPAVTLTQLNMALDWKQLPTGLRVSMERFILQHPDLLVSARGVLDDFSAPAAGVMHMTGEFSANNAEQWLAYIPSKFLKPKLDIWLKEQIMRIAKAEGQFVVDGPLADFPFDTQPGEFLIKSYLTGVDLFFAPFWPLTKDIEASLTVDKRLLEADVRHAYLDEVGVSQINIRVTDLGLLKENLLIHGAFASSAKKIMKYIVASPLREHLAKLALLSIQKPLAVDLHLDIPLYAGDSKILVNGAVTFDENRILLSPMLSNTVLERLSGILKFNEAGVVDSTLQGHIWDEDILLKPHLRTGEHPATEVGLDSHINIGVLANNFKLPLTTFLQGRTHVTGKLVFPSNKKAMDELHLVSNLQGIAINLPSPLGKTKQEKVPLQVDLDFNMQTSMRLRAEYAGQSRIDAWFTKVDKNFIFQRGAFYGKGTVLADIKYLPETRTLTGNFSRLTLAKALFDGHSSHHFSMPSPGVIPNLDLTADMLVYGDIELGSVVLKSTSTATTWQLDSGILSSPEYELTLKGAWQKDNTQNISQLDGVMKIKSLGKSLERWHITPAVEAKKGEISFHSSWPRSMLDFSLSALTGQAFMQFKNGRITNLSPETEEKLGLGKLLSILSLQTIPRRLQLDFSDLSKGGYSFDEFKGHFDIKNGVMNTTDSYIEGPVAYASMHGDLDLAKKLYDLNLRVSPHIAASLPIVATIAGGPVAGPVAGIATWVAIKIINHGMEKISGYTYKITGPWLTPVVQQVSIVRTPAADKKH